jgi:hypothetical protein
MKRYFDREYLLTPLAIERVRQSITTLSYVGIARIRIFGFTIAEIQLTNPWK